jgi:hypothetical protein
LRRAEYTQTNLLTLAAQTVTAGAACRDACLTAMFGHSLLGIA